MDGVAERIKARDYIEGHARGHPPNIARWNGNIISEGAVAINADPHGVGAEVPATGEAVTAVTANNMPFARDELAQRKSSHARTDIGHGADIFMTNDERRFDGPLRPRVPLINMHIRSTNRGFLNLDQDIIQARRGHGYFGHDEAGSGRGLNDGAHFGGHKKGS